MNTDVDWYAVDPHAKCEKGLAVFDPCTKYAIRIIQEEIESPYLIRKVAERHLDDINRSYYPSSGIKWEWEELYKFAHFTKTFCMIPDRLKGKPAPLELLDPFMFCYGMFLGWKVFNPHRDPKIDKLERHHGSKRYSTMFLETPKGSGKTPVAGAYILYHLIGANPPPVEEGEAYDPPVIFVATDQASQGDVIKGYIDQFIENDLFSVNRRGVHFANKQYNCTTANSFCAFKSSRALGATGTSGFAPSLIVIEEAQDHKSMRLHDNLLMGTKNRIEAQVIYCLNAGMKNQSAIWPERAKAERVARGIVKQDNYLPMIWSIEKDDDPLKDKNCMYKAYPTLGITIDENYINKQIEWAKTSARAKSEFLRLNCGRWSSGSTEDWIDFSIIEECFTKEKPQRDDWEELPMVIGLDLSYSKSLSGYVKCYLLPDNTVWLEAHGYTCSKGVQDILSVATDLELNEWIKNPQGGLKMADTITGEMIDLDPIAKQLYEDSQKYKGLKAVAVDSFGKDRFYEALMKYTIDFTRDNKSAVSASKIQKLGGLHFIEHPNTKHRKTLKFSGNRFEELFLHDSIERMADRISKKTIRFLDNPTFAWNFGCVQVNRKGNSMVMMKQDAEEVMAGRIDLVAASFYALGVMELALVNEKRNKQFNPENSEALPKLFEAMDFL